MNERTKLLQSDNKIDFCSTSYLRDQIEKWRSIVGVDPIYEIDVKIVETSDSDHSDVAWIDGLEQENAHPNVTIFFNVNFLQNNKDNEHTILDTIIHELCHIIVWESLIMANPKYKYSGLQARASEILVIKITSAIMKIYNNKQENKH